MDGLNRKMEKTEEIISELEDGGRKGEKETDR